MASFAFSNVAEDVDITGICGRYKVGRIIKYLVSHVIFIFHLYGENIR